MPNDQKPKGPAQVRRALLDATIDLIVSRGTDISVRTIAEEAGVNHGLIHTYFGSKRALISAAFDEVNRRAAEDLRDDGFPIPDLANRRGGELARAIARIRLEQVDSPFSSHPVTASWLEALSRHRPELTTQTMIEMVALASGIALGWAVFADYLCDLLGIDGNQRTHLDQQVADLVAEVGGIPEADR